MCRAVQIFYDPHELMASLVDARNLSYKSPEADTKVKCATTSQRTIAARSKIG